MNTTYPHEDIQALINSETVVIFGKGEKDQPMCGFTANVQQAFESLGIDYLMINILSDEDLRLEMKTFSEWPTFPQVYINQEFIGGCDIVLELYKNGQLVTED